MAWITSLLLFFIFSDAGELPKRYDIQNVPLSSVPITRELQISAKVKIPKGYHSTQLATLNIYEGQPGGWKLTRKIKQKDRSLDVFNQNNDLVFKNNITLKSDEADIAFDLSVSFCQKICVINNFQGIAKRSSQAKNSHLKFEVEGQLPSQRMKKKKANKVSMNF